MAEGDLDRQRDLAQAFLQASRGGDSQALLNLLDPEVVLRADAGVSPPHGVEVRGAQVVARRASLFGGRAVFSHLALVDGKAGIIVAPGGRLVMVLAFATMRGKIVGIDIIGDTARLGGIDLAVLTL